VRVARARELRAGRVGLRAWSGLRAALFDDAGQRFAALAAWRRERRAPESSRTVGSTLRKVALRRASPHPLLPCSAGGGRVRRAAGPAGAARIARAPGWRGLRDDAGRLAGDRLPGHAEHPALAALFKSDQADRFDEDPDWARAARRAAAAGGGRAATSAGFAAHRRRRLPRGDGLPARSRPRRRPQGLRAGPRALDRDPRRARRARRGRRRGGRAAGAARRSRRGALAARARSPSRLPRGLPILPAQPKLQRRRPACPASSCPPRSRPR